MTELKAKETGYHAAPALENRPVDEPASDVNVDSLTSLITRVSSQSASQIDGLISDLTEVRHYLRTEGRRVQREITQFALLNQSTMASTKIIRDALGPAKAATKDQKAIGSLAPGLHYQNEASTNPA